MTIFNLAQSTMRVRSLVTYLLLAILVAGAGTHLWLGRSADPEFILQAVGVVLGLCLVAEEIVRLTNSPARPGPFVETKGDVDG